MSSKACFVKDCPNNSDNCPKQFFLTVPRDGTRKKFWFEAARRVVPQSKGTHFCCEDHFNFEEDMENFIKYKLVGGNIVLKRHVVPHVFQWQQCTEILSSVYETEEPLSKKRKVKTDCLPSTSGSTQVIKQVSVGVRVKTVCYNVGLQTEPKKESHKKDVSVSAVPSLKSIYITCKIQPKRVNAHVDTSDLTVSSDMDISPFKQPCRKPLKVKKQLFQRQGSSRSITSEDETAPATSEFIPSSVGSESASIFGKNEDWVKELEMRESRESTIKVIEKNPKRYAGVPKKWYPILINLLCEKGNLSKNNILLCLMKIKLNDSFMRLGDQFGIAYSTASFIFKKTIPKIEHFLKTVIFWPKSEVIRELLPIPFRVRYSKVEAIIDCLEIQIQKPTNPLKQALTWSEYKKNNTVKYLISCTPEGFINFVSSGYGGRASDVTILEQSNFLNVLVEGCHVMADRGFKHVNSLLAKKNCTLVRPPSVSTNQKPTKAEVIESKRIASLRIHIERVIKRLREYAFLKPHSVIDHNLIAYTDSIIIICCASINLQSPIIRK